MNRTAPLLAAALCVLMPPAWCLELVADGRPVATLVIPDDALPVVSAAAREFQYHVQKASGAELPIVKASSNPQGPGLIFLGPCPQTAALALDLAALQPNGSYIRVADGNLYLLGDDSPGEVFWIQHENRTRVGTLFAVYEVLAGQLGVRWLWPGPLGEVVPRQTTISVDIEDQTLTPRFMHTRWRDGGAYNGDLRGWSDPQVRSVFLNEQGKWLRRHRFAMGVSMDMRHSFTEWWERFGADHPEYFNLLPDGTRRPDPTYFGSDPTLVGMCVGEPAVWRQKVADWSTWRTPQAPFLDASENDTSGKCTCPLCLAMDEPDPDNAVPFDQRVAAAREAFEAGKIEWPNALGSVSDRYARFYLAVQQEARKVDPQAVVMGYAYANYVKPPRATKLNPDIIIGIVPALMFPWTAAKRQAFIEQWEGWGAAGARLFLRPNYTLDGHCLPVNFARALGEDFSFAVHHGLIGTDFDSLTGQYAAQGPNLYMLARLTEAPDLTPQQVLDEFCAAFGPAAGKVRDYFDLWERVSAAVTDAQVGHWASFYREAGAIFTEDLMAEGKALLADAAAAAQGDAEASQRVAFLASGLEQAELVLATQRTYVEYKRTGALAEYGQALKRLDDFRARNEADLIANMAYLNWSEAQTWDRELVKLMATPGEQMPDTWRLAWDPDNVGEAQEWFAPDRDASAWLPVGTSAPWEGQEVGKRWRAEHGEDFNGFAWYRNTVTLTPAQAGQQVRLVFGAVDEACKVWVNGKLLLDRPFPWQGNTNSWQEAFEVDATAAVRFDGPNVVAVRVEDNSGAGGIWKPVWIVVAEAPAADNLLDDGTFETGPGKWGQSTMAGEYAFAIDETVAHSGRASARIECKAVGPEGIEKTMGSRAWGRWYQPVPAAEKGKPYRLRLWVRTAPGFTGSVNVWLTGTTKGTLEARMLNTDGIWREVTIPDAVPAEQGLSLYLNLYHATGTAWFDDVELTPQ